MRLSWLENSYSQPLFGGRFWPTKLSQTHLF